MTDGPGPHARALLDAARPALAPTEADRARIRHALQAKLTPSTPPPAAAGAATASKLALIVGLPVAVAVVALLVPGADPSSPQAPPAAREAEAPSAPSPWARAGSEPGPGLDPVTPAQVGLAPGERATTETSPRQRGREPDLSSHDGAPQRVRSVRAGRAVPRSPASTQPSPTSLEQELVLLRDARRALSANPRRARALARSHADRFPEGLLAEEARALELLAGCALRDADARERARRYVGTPSPHAARVVESCELRAGDGSDSPRTPTLRHETGGNR